MKYRNLFFDLDDTIWAFSRNARDTFEEVYRKYSFERYFDSFDHYYTIYQQRNTELWIEYGEGKRKCLTNRLLPTGNVFLILCRR